MPERKEIDGFPGTADPLQIPTVEFRGASAGRQQMVDWLERASRFLGSSRVDLQACKLEYSIVSPK